MSGGKDAAGATRRSGLRLGHLAARFGGSIVARRLSPAEQAWVAGVLTPAEAGLFAALGRADQREAYATAQRAERALIARVGAADAVWLAAALLHDLGKAESGLGPIGRSLATVAAALAGPDRTRRWREEASGPRARLAAYARHDELGALRIRDAGGRESVARWAAVHHTPAQWSVVGIPDEVARVLAEADGERVPA